MIHAHEMWVYMYLEVNEGKNKSYREGEVIIKMRITERTIVRM